jgi:hypothetical protein
MTTTAAIVNESSDDFLANPTLSGDQHLRSGAGRIVDFFFDTANRGTDTEHREVGFHYFLNRTKVLILNMNRRHNAKRRNGI